MHYCYGLSVLNSHLLRGAGLILTDLSVADPCFWQLFRGPGRHQLRRRAVHVRPARPGRLRRHGPAPPALRSPRPAAGSHPTQVARYAALGRRDGWRPVRHVRPDRGHGPDGLPAAGPRRDPAVRHRRADPRRGVPPRAGRPRRPGRTPASWSTRGPNVMLGYADGPADLALGRTVDELRTGDLARRAPGRALRDRRPAEPVREDPRAARRPAPGRGHAGRARHHGLLRRATTTSWSSAVADGDARRDPPAAGAERCGLPGRAVRVHALPELPRLANGKPDYAAVARPARPARAAARRRAADPHATCVALYAEILDRTDVTEESSFVGLGGDSLSYVEMSIRLEQALGHLPADWPTVPIRDLRPGRRERPRRRAGRPAGDQRGAAGHRDRPDRRHPRQLFAISGGAHLLLGVAGFNFARFHLTDAPRAERVRGLAAQPRPHRRGQRRLDRRWSTCSPTTTRCATCSCCTTSSGHPANTTTTGSSRRSSTSLARGCAL